jgi:flagellar hook protein FlgE
MSLFTTLNTASSGLSLNSANLGVIGDNIANVGTVGFKGTRSEFTTFLPNDTFGLAGPTTIGIGAAVEVVTTQFGQGSITESSNSLDMAISGSGFFVVNDGFQNYFTRAGEFYMDEFGYVVDANGLNLQGYQAQDGVMGATVQSILIDERPISQLATSEIMLKANLSAEEDFSTTPIASGTFDIISGAGDTLIDSADAADYATSVTVYDSLGVAHEVTILFERAADDTWTWHAVVDAGELEDGTGTFTEGAAFQISEGTLTFNTDGELVTFTQTNTSATTPWNFEGAGAQDYTFDFGIDATGVATDGQVLMASGPSTVSEVSQDGYPPGQLLSLSVELDGTIIGHYDNGEQIQLAQVVQRIGGNLFRQSSASGDPAIGVAGTGGRGDIIGNALEKSNVDIEDQFVEMITTQRSYQANARVVSTANQTLQELVQLV